MQHFSNLLAAEYARWLASTLNEATQKEKIAPVGAAAGAVAGTGGNGAGGGKAAVNARPSHSAFFSLFGQHTDVCSGGGGAAAAQSYDTTVTGATICSKCRHYNCECEKGGKKKKLAAQKKREAKKAKKKKE